MEKKKVRLTIDNGIEDIEILKAYGRIILRQIKIERITDEAIEHGGVLSQEDLSKYLNCTVRTIQRDIKAIKKKGIEVVTRGYLHSIGRGQTHKVKIIGMYLDGKTYSEIKLTARHSSGAIKRYLESFTKVLMAQSKGIYERKEISAVTGISEGLVKQYLDLIRESKKDKTRKENLKDLISRNSYRSGDKKNSKVLFRASGSYDGRLVMSLNPTRDRYESRKRKRNFRTAIINLLENEYKILGALRKIIEMLADDLENLHREYYPAKVKWALER